MLLYLWEGNRRKGGWSSHPIAKEAKAMELSIILQLLNLAAKIADILITVYRNKKDK